MITSNLGNFISAGVNAAIMIAALFTFAFLIWGGIQWLTSGGDAAAYEAARGKITAALIGLAIVAAAWALMELIGFFYGINILEGMPPVEASPPTPIWLIAVFILVPLVFILSDTIGKLYTKLSRYLLISDEKEHAINVSIVGAMLRQRASDDIKVHTILLLGTTLYLLVSRTLNVTPNNFIILIPLILSLLRIVDTGILQYRIRKGLYGTIEDDAREVITFILEEAKGGKTGPGDGGTKRILSPNEIAEVKESLERNLGLAPVIKQERVD